VVGCAGHTDDEADKGDTLTLYVSSDKVTADGVEKVAFSVFCGDADVTEESEIVCVGDGSKLLSPVFSTEQIGKYVFRALYEGTISEDVQVEAVSRFKRRVCVMEFTGTWCSQCPDGALLVNNLVEDTFRNQAYALAFHNDDEYTIPAEAALRGVLKYSAYPSYSVDMRDTGELNGFGCRNAIKYSLNESQTHCAVSVTCRRESGRGMVGYKVFSELQSDYKVAAYVVEDRVIGRQLEGNNVYDEQYVHRHMVRKMLSVSVGGDDLGRLSAGEERTGNFEFDIDSLWNGEMLYVAVLAIGEDGYVNNMAICSVNGGTMDYEYRNM